MTTFRYEIVADGEVGVVAQTEDRAIAEQIADSINRVDDVTVFVYDRDRGNRQVYRVPDEWA